MTEDAELFQAKFPEFTEASSVEAKEFWDANGQFVSVDGRGVALNGFAVQFATQFRKHGPFVMNETTARALCRLLIESGFGPDR